MAEKTDPSAVIRRMLITQAEREGFDADGAEFRALHHARRTEGGALPIRARPAGGSALDPGQVQEALPLNRWLIVVVALSATTRTRAVGWTFLVTR